jgi:hypothetical protein
MDKHGLIVFDLNLCIWRNMDKYMDKHGLIIQQNMCQSGQGKILWYFARPQS